MKTHRDRFGLRLILLGGLVAAAWSAWLPAVETQPPPPADAVAAQPGSEAPRPWTPEEMESLVAPIALYPDPLLAQALAASTYPLELVEAKQWLERHPELKGKELTEAAAKQNWDPSVQAMVTFPDVLNRLTENIGWTTDLGNAFLAQQADVMDAVQRLRLEAKAAGKLRSTREQEVTAKVIEERTVVEIVPADPEVIYVPIYSPRVIWGAPVYYDYPSLWYPSAADYWISFGLGVTMSWYYPGWNYWYAGGWPWGWGWSWSWGWPWGWNWGWGWGWNSGWGWSGWGWGCGWGRHHGVYYNGHFCDHYGYHHNHHGHHGHHDGGHHSGQWQHDSYHRGGVPYRTNDVARRYGADSVRTASARRSAGGDYASRSRTGIARGEPGQSASRSASAYRSAGAGRSVTSRNDGWGSVPTNRSGNRATAVNRSFSRDATTGAYRNTVTGRTRSAEGTSTYSSRASGSVTPSSGSRAASNASFARDRSAGDTGSRAYSTRSYGSSSSASSRAYSSRSYGSSNAAGSRAYSSRSYGSSNAAGSPAYSGSRSYGTRTYSAGGAARDRSYSNSPSYGNRSFSSGSSSGGRAYSGGGYSGSRSYGNRSYSAPSGGRSYSGGSRSYSSGGSRSYSGGGSRSYSGGGSRSYSGGGSRSYSGGGSRSYSGGGSRSYSGGGSRGGSSGGGSRSSSGGGSRGGRR